MEGRSGEEERGRGEGRGEEKERGREGNGEELGLLGWGGAGRRDSIF